MLVAKCPAASFVCCAAKCFRPPTRHAVPAKSAWPVMGFYHAKSLRHHALWKGSVVWAYGGRQSMARPRRHRPSPTACRGRSRSLMTVTERRVKEARREPTQGSIPPPGRGLPWRMDHGEGIFLPVALALPDRKRNGALPNSRRGKTRRRAPFLAMGMTGGRGYWFFTRAQERRGVSGGGSPGRWYPLDRFPPG